MPFSTETVTKHFENGKCELISRNRNTFASFRRLAAEIAGHFKGENGVLDGEIVSLDERGSVLLGTRQYTRPFNC